ncbi:MAG: type II secretion system F family protein [Cyanobacteria bacterium HKST-UBA04]|nr:type II secretion system F family protein [Cyanobacteria bacterium HKST-UBA04]MCA9841785.1 type II secretion system F family protein [Cyanobacteria bacterium HKST-UBA03]
MPMEAIIVGVVIFGCMLLAAFGFMMSKNQKEIADRVETLNESGSASPMAKTGRQKQMDDSFTQRVFFPFAQALSGKVQAFLPMSSQSWIKKKLIQGGYHQPNTIRLFIGTHLIMTVAPQAFMLVLFMIKGSIDTGGIVYMGLLTFAGFAFPILWLLQQSGKRQTSIQRALPDFIDLLVICVEAGLPLDSAIAKIASLEGVQTSNFLREELIHYTRDVGFGKARKQALTDLADRTGVEDLNAVISAIIQAYEMGTGVTLSLKVQSDMLRQKRMTRAEEKANKIGVKMVLPIYFFFFPSIFMIILGPLLLHVYQTVVHIMGNVKF